MKVLKTIKNIVLLFSFICLIMALVDFIRIKNAKEPVFCIKKYIPIGEKLTYRGFFYQADRTIKGSVNESLDQSYNVHYTFLFKTFDIKYDKNKDVIEDIYYIENKECLQFNKYLEIEGLTIYTNCIESIKVKKTNEKSSTDLDLLLDKDPIMIDKLINNMAFMGMIREDIEKYNSNSSFSTKPFTLYRCSNNNVIYITEYDYYDDSICTRKKNNKG